MGEENPYYGYFKETVGRGNGKYYTGIGHVYTARRGIQRGTGFFVPGASMYSQRGMGFGSVFSSLFRMASPILKVLGLKAVDVVSNIAKDTIDGQNVKESVIKHVSNEGKQLLGKVPTTIKNILNKTGLTEEQTNSQAPEAEVSTPFEIVHQKQPSKRRGKVVHSKIKSKVRRGSGKYPALKFMI